MKRRTLIRILAALAAVVILIGVAGIAVLRSPWFHEQVRARMIREIEKASGGKTEVGGYRFDWSTMTAEVNDFALHGNERPGEPAFLRVKRVAVGLKIISAFRRQVDLASGLVEQPEFHLIVRPDGTTNLPVPGHKTEDNFIDSVLKLKVRRYEVRGGVIEFREDRIPLDIRGDDLNASLDYLTGPEIYQGHLSSRQLHIATAGILPLIGNFDTDLTFGREGLRFPKMSFAWPKSKIELAGSLADWKALHGEFDVKAGIEIAELGPVLRLPLERRGEAVFNGKVKVAFAPEFDYDIHGRFTGRGLAYSAGRIQIAGIAAAGEAEVRPSGVSIPRLKASALSGTFEGKAVLPKFKSFEVEGEAAGLSLSQLAQFGTDRPFPWSGLVSGHVNLSGRFEGKRLGGFVAHAVTVIQRAEGGIPLEGNADVTYNQAEGVVQLADTRLSTPASQVLVSGTLGQALTVSVRTNDLKDILPALRFASDHPPDSLPVNLDRGGSITAEASITGPLSEPRITGKLTAADFVVQKRRFDGLTAAFDVNRRMLTARGISLEREGVTVTGDAALSLADWSAGDNSTMKASLRVANADVQKLIAESGEKLDITGSASAELKVEGTLGSPALSGRITALNVSGFGEKLDQIRADVRYSGEAFEAANGEARFGPARASFSGAYKRRGPDWTSGNVSFKASSTGFRIEQFKHIQSLEHPLAGEAVFNITGTGSVSKGNFDLTTLKSEASVRGLMMSDSRLGNASLTAETSSDHMLKLALTGNLRNARLTGDGAWKLEGEYPGRGEIEFTPISFGTLQRVAEAAGSHAGDLPFQGRLNGKVTVTGPLRNFDQLRADVVIPELEIRPPENQRIRPGVREADIVLRNTSPVAFTATSKKVVIQSARFTATDTNIEATGSLSSDAKSPWDLRVNGSMNMKIVALFVPDLQAEGNAVVNAAITGALNDPQLNGSMELRGASLYLSDITTGVDNANGLVTFDRNRATIQRLTAEVGGGRVAFGGFIGFSGGLVLYRVQANADQVRIRYPEGVSTTVNAQLDLTGTSANSLVSGTVTIVRAGFTPKADLGSLLAQTAKPVTSPSAPNEYLRNIGFDVKIESGPSLQFQTSLTRDLQAEADLRLRGNAARPALLGNVSVNEGEVNLFGTKYSINRGEIRFLNPTRVEPVFDVDLETKARGITVNISFTGTLTKLNLTYRSDPPLQTSEIIALIAVGRDPTTSAALAGSQITQGGMLQAGGNALGQALTAPVTSRLQRFFGVSRLKIDPLLTGVENIPQARLTLEQQVSRDITLTYITNLTRTQEQIVRIQWDINREWSAIATREENGVFGVDFQFRKRLK